MVGLTLIGKTQVFSVYITVPSGSGTTTLAAGLSQQLMLAYEAFINWASHYETGELPGRNKISQKSFLERMKKSGGSVLELDGLLSPEE